MGFAPPGIRLAQGGPSPGEAETPPAREAAALGPQELCILCSRLATAPQAQPIAQHTAEVTRER